MRALGIALLLSTVASALACSAADGRAVPRPVLRLVRDVTIGDTLHREYSERLPGIDFQQVEAVGSVGAVEAIERGEADAAFVLGDVAYFAHQRSDPGARARVQLRGMAALHLAPIHLVVRAGLRANTIDQLRGLKIGVGSALSGQTLLTGLIFRAFNLGHEIVQPGPRADLLAGVDASFATGYYPAPTVVNALRQGARLVPIAGEVADHLRQDYPFVQPVTIPAGTYPGQSAPLRTIGVDRMLVCRSDLDERIVHDLTRHFLEALPSLTARVRTSLRLTDLALASATSIPLHNGAAQYYRERELSR